MDAMLIEQVITNLLYNATLHGRRTSVINVSVKPCGGCAAFLVEDNGVGLPEDILSRINNGSYRQADKEGIIDDSRGMGIGLSVCMTIIRAHGGIIKAENVPGGGALLRFTLPLEE
jgi:two-component system sensor histidine kinase KdpD